MDIKGERNFQETQIGKRKCAQLYENSQTPVDPSGEFLTPRFKPIMFDRKRVVIGDWGLAVGSAEDLRDSHKFHQLNQPNKLN